MRQFRTEAHTCHLRLASADRDRDMERIDWVGRIGDINDHRPVLFRFAAVQRIGQGAWQVLPAMQAHERDGPPIRVDDDVWLIGPTKLQVAVSDETHILLLAALADGESAAYTERQNGKGNAFAR